LSVCIFPEGGVPDDESFFWIRLRMVLSDLLEHQIPIVPISFADNKETFLYFSVVALNAC
jgi:1-acyl-sn-glycerol-3-phosphate acyltransferase